MDFKHVLKKSYYRFSLTKVLSNVTDSERYPIHLRMTSLRNLLSEWGSFKEILTGPNHALQAVSRDETQDHLPASWHCVTLTNQAAAPWVVIGNDRSGVHEFTMWEWGAGIADGTRQPMCLCTCFRVLKCFIFHGNNSGNPTYGEDMSGVKDRNDTGRMEERGNK